MSEDIVDILKNAGYLVVEGKEETLKLIDRVSNVHSVDSTSQRPK